jgi:hypothetical protein
VGMMSVDRAVHQNFGLGSKLASAGYRVASGGLHTCFRCFQCFQCFQTPRETDCGGPRCMDPFDDPSGSSPGHARA